MQNQSPACLKQIRQKSTTWVSWLTNISGQCVMHCGIFSLPYDWLVNRLAILGADGFRDTRNTLSIPSIIIHKGLKNDRNSICQLQKHYSRYKSPANTQNRGSSGSCEPVKSNQCMLLLIYYNDLMMSAMASKITNPTIVYSTIYSGADQRKHQSSASLAFVRGIHWWPVNSPYKGSVTRKMFPFDDFIIIFAASQLVLNVISVNYTKMTHDMLYSPA